MTTRAAPDHPRSATLARVRRYAPLLAMVVVAIAVSFVVRHDVFPAYSWNRDEPVYLWQARALRAGHLVTTDGGAPAFFQPWLAGARDGTFFSQYTLGWPAALTASAVLFGSAGFALAISAALAVLATYLFTRELTGDHTLALVAAAVMTASPILVVQSGMYLGYLFSLGVGLLFAASLLHALRRSRPGLLVMSGLLLGVVFLTRPFDTILWAAPFAAYLAVTRRREARRLLVAGALVAAGFAPLLLAGLAYNKHVTGSFTQFPITAADPIDKFGFGVRSIMPNWQHVDYTVVNAFKGSGRNLVFLPEFLVGSFAGVVAAAAGLWLRRRDRTTLALLALGAAFPIGYFFFWGIYLSGTTVTLTGPLYDIPLYAPLSILIATALVAAWRRRRVIGVALLAVLVGGTAYAFVDKIDANHHLSLVQAPWRASEKQIGGRALVFVDQAGPYLVNLNPFSVNSPGIDGRLVYAVDRGAQDLDLIASRPGRTPYLQSPSYVLRDVLHSPKTIDVTVTRLRVVRSGRVAVHARVTNPTGRPVVVASLQVGSQVVSRTLDSSSTKGAVYETDWTVAFGNASGADLAAPPDRLGTVTVATGTGVTVADAGRAQAQQQFPYRLVGPGAEILTPGRGFRTHLKKGRTVFRAADTRSDLDVTVTAAVNPT